MELRKVQQTGGSSLSVTLPKAWADRARLAPGSLVGLLELPDGSLAVQADGRAGRAPRRTEIVLEGDEAGFLFRKIIAAYLAGHDVIALRSRKPLAAAARAAVRRAAARIMGLEIVEEDAHTVTLQDFLDPGEFHMDRALRRMEALTRVMQDEAVEALRAPREELLRSVRDRDDEVDRLYWLVNKQYHRVLGDAAYAARMDTTPAEGLNMLLVARLVERTADHAARIAAQAVALPHGRAPDLVLRKVERQMRSALDLFRASLAAFHGRDAAKADALIEEAKRFPEAQERLLREAFALGTEAVSHYAVVLESVGRTAAYAADVGEVAINHKVAGAR